MKQLHRIPAVLAIALLAGPLVLGQGDSRPRARDIGLSPGVLDPGPHNAITDVPGVLVGQVTLMEGDHIRTGVTAILPHAGNVFQEKVPGAVHIGNAFGKLAGSTQVVELGTIETPVVLTNTLSVWDAARAVVTYTLGLPGNEDVRSVNPLVGETNDGYLNNIRGLHVKESHVLEAIRTASAGPVAEGAVGAGTGTSAFGWKGGIGTSSRRLPESLGGYTVGALIQSNYGGVLVMDGIPVGEELDRYYLRDQLRGGDGAARRRLTGQPGRVHHDGGGHRCSDPLAGPHPAGATGDARPRPHRGHLLPRERRLRDRLFLGGVAPHRLPE